MSDPTEYTPSMEHVRYAYERSYDGPIAELERFFAEHDRQVSERVHDDTVTVMSELMPRGHTWVVPVNPHRKAVDE